ncbi:MAG: glycosyltransferase family 39 protein [Oculatellaceae cyanobacterium bins.114]|nr:glycosyltransferase family 39 protein [Oculatellaceae cyanobacterium bins.114]
MALNKTTLHSFRFAAILLVGAALRFWHLDTKPLWMDEVLTAIFSLGRSYDDIPTQEFFAIADLQQLFTVQVGVSCPQITKTVATESVHPPLFFCLLHGWMSWLKPGADDWIWALRALPALFGVGAIAAIYWLNRIAFSATAGLLAAALMAVSPFAVYLSQEARHYTLPMLLITLALVGLVQMQQDIQHRQVCPWVWLGWVGVNVLALYTHYFCILALIAQVVAFGGWMLWRRVPAKAMTLFGLAVVVVGLSYLPWLSTVMSHFSRPETDWLTPQDPTWLTRLAPIYQTLVGWMLMVIALPIQDEHWAIALFVIAVIGLFLVWLVRQAVQGAKQQWQQPSSRSALVLIAGFTACVVAQFFAIAYGLDKDITAVPRYNFVYYPGMCALLGVCLASLKGGVFPAQPKLLRLPYLLKPGSGLLQAPSRRWAIVLMAGFLSSLLVVQGWVLQKSYNPDEVAEDVLLYPAEPLIVVTNYRSLQEIALGLSIALELQTHDSYIAEIDQRVHPDVGAIAPDLSMRFGFLDRRPQTDPPRLTLAQMTQPLPLPLRLWVVSPESRRQDFPPHLRLANTNSLCTRDPEEYHRLGFPYQLYRC